MKIFDWLKKNINKINLGILALLFFLMCSLPAFAANQTSTEIEQQVLQIIRQNPDVIFESLQTYQQNQQQNLQEAQQLFLKDLKNNPETIIGDSPTNGSIIAQVVLIEFSDFQCPYCAEAYKKVKNLILKYGKKIKVVYKNLPLTTIHSEAMPAARAAWAAYKQGKFWEFHEQLFTNQNKLGEELYIHIAENLNLDLQKFEQDRQIADEFIQKDIEMAESLGISGTPFFVINSQTFSGVVQLEDVENILAGRK